MHNRGAQVISLHLAGCVQSGLELMMPIVSLYSSQCIPLQMRPSFPGRILRLAQTLQSAFRNQQDVDRCGATLPCHNMHGTAL